MAEASAQDDSEETDLVERLLKMFSADFFKPQNISRLSSTWCGNFQTFMYISYFDASSHC